jgi:beta-xylosidase
VYVTPNSGVQFFRRTSPGGMVAVTTLAGISAPCWLRLRRTENRFYAYYSLDGTIWNQIGSHANVSVGAGSYIGLAITSGSVADTANSSITGVDFTP